MWLWDSWLSQRGMSATYLISLSPCVLVSSEADDLTTMVMVRVLLGNAYTKFSWVGVWEFQESERLLISLQPSQHWSPSAVSLISLSWKIKTHETTLSLAPRKGSWVGDGERKSFLKTFSGPLTQQQVWALLRAWITSEGGSSLAWEPHWDKAGAPWGNSHSLWNLTSMTLNAQKDTLNSTFQKSI